MCLKEKNVKTYTTAYLTKFFSTADSEAKLKQNLNYRSESLKAF
jgi:hypothetical protein